MEQDTEQDLVTEQSMTADLRALGVKEGMVVLVHSSLTAIGWVCGAPILVDGGRRWVSYREPDIDEDDFDEVGAAFERHATGTRTGVVGQARCKLLPVRPLVDFAIPWLKRHRNDGD